MKNFIQPGHILTVVAPAAVTSGELVAVGQLIGVAVHSAALGESLSLQMAGVFGDLPKAAEAFNEGDPVYYDPADGTLAKTKAAGMTLVGAATADAAINDATMSARLDGVTRPAEV